MSIGTAKPSEEERATAPHHFIDNLSIETPYSVGDYERDALILLDELYQKQEVVVLTGGSGLYQKALCEGLDEFPEVPADVRAKVVQLYETSGIEALQSVLQECDPDYFAQVDRNNQQRLIRAISVFRASGQPFSSFRKAQKADRPFTAVYLYLNPDRNELYERINQRVTLMVEAGLVEEARRLYPKRHLDALQTVGYQELFDYFDQKTTLEEALDLIRQHTRNYAKRQNTWARRDGFWKYVRPDEMETALEELERDLMNE